MPRNFDGVDDLIDCSIGTVTWAYGSAWAVVYFDVVALTSIITIYDTATNRVQFQTNATGKVRLAIATNTAGSTTLSTGTWYFLGWSKDTGSSTPRFHIYDYSANTWTHENGGAAMADATTTATNVRFGANAGGANLFDGRIAAAGLRQLLVLSDAEFENLAHKLRHWLYMPGATAPVGMWVFDQAATTQPVNDWTDGNAHESAITGTSVGSESSPIGYGGIQ